MLVLRDVTAGYDGSSVIHGISLEVKAGQIVTLLGANGAGKSTLASVLSGLLPLQAGEITFENEPIGHLTPRLRVERGIVHVPEGRQVFAHLTVAENLELGAFAASGRLGQSVINERIEWSCATFPDLRKSLRKPAGTLSGGQQQMLAIARGLMAKPKLLVLDEPSLGLSPVFVTKVFQIVEELKRSGISILLSEQNAYASLSLADYGYLMELGRIALKGPSAELLQNKTLAERYLGLGHGSTGGDPKAQREMTEELRYVLSGRNSPVRRHV